jgi:hypothetical protein
MLRLLFDLSLKHICKQASFFRDSLHGYCLKIFSLNIAPEALGWLGQRCQILKRSARMNVNGGEGATGSNGNTTGVFGIWDWQETNWN